MGVHEIRHTADCVGLMARYHVVQDASTQYVQRRPRLNYICSSNQQPQISFKSTQTTRAVLEVPLLMEHLLGYNKGILICMRKGSKAIGHSFAILIIWNPSYRHGERTNMWKTHGDCPTHSPHLFWTFPHISHFPYMFRTISHTCLQKRLNCSVPSLSTLQT